MNPPNRFSLGSTELTPPHVIPTTKRPSLLRHSLLLVLGSVVLVALGITLVLGTRFTQDLQFENTPISFFEGMRLIGQGLLASPQDLAGYEDGRINILLLGRAGEGKPGKHLTDTVMLLSVNTRERKVALLSFPRDLLVPLPDTTATVKLNTLYQYGRSSGEGGELIRKSVSTITGLPIHYFTSIDFDGFERVIDALGGITIDVVRDIRDTRYPGPNYSYETFTIQKGWQKLDGKTALKYARSRHGDPEGDFGRAKRQQQILEAVRDRAWSLPTFLNPLTLTRLLESLGESVDTDISPEEAHALLALADTIDTHALTSVVVDAWKKESLLRVTHIESSSGRAFALIPRSGTWNEVQTLAKNIFDIETLQARQKEIEKEAVTLLIIAPETRLTVANDLASDIRDTFPVANVSIKTFRGLENVTGSAIIERSSATRKLYTLDSLIGRYDLRREDTLPFTLPQSFPAADLILLYTRDTIPGLIHEIPPEDMGDFPES